MLSELAMGRDEPVSFDTRERKGVENLANLFAVIRTVEALERAFANGSVETAEYEKNCQQLIAQFKVVRSALKGQSVEEFIAEHQMDVPLAQERLLKTGVAATQLYDTGSRTKGHSLQVFEVSTHFMTLMDALKLNMRAVDEIVPTLRDLVGSLSKMPQGPDGVANVDKVTQWLVTLNGMKASDEISEDQARQFMMDVEAAYHSFEKFLRSE